MDLTVAVLNLVLVVYGHGSVYGSHVQKRYNNSLVGLLRTWLRPIKDAD